MAEPLRPAFPVVLDGWPLVAFTIVLRKHLPDYLETLRPSVRVPLEEAYADCEAQSRAWQAWRRGTAEQRDAEPALESAAMDATLTTRQAAEQLGCSERWVRKLIATGGLPARRDSRGWRIDEAAVLAIPPRQGDSR